MLVDCIAFRAGGLFRLYPSFLHHRAPCRNVANEKFGELLGRSAAGHHTFFWRTADHLGF